MFKFLVKVVVVVIALQTSMGYLRKEGIITGEIKINYPVVKEKIMKIIPTDKIAQTLQDYVTQKIKESLASKLDDWQQDLNTSSMVATGETRRTKVLVHVISDGETLSEISHIYDVPWQVIMKVNQLADDNNLTIGQQIKIPSRIKNIT